MSFIARQQSPLCHAVCGIAGNSAQLLAFGASNLFSARDPGKLIEPTVLNAACQSAVAASGLFKRVTVHTLRHSFATHLLENGTNIRIIQALLGHAHLSSIAHYTRVSNKTHLLYDKPARAIAPRGESAAL